MRDNNLRDSIIGKTELPDWLVPVLYQQKNAGINIIPTPKYIDCQTSNLPSEILEVDKNNFIGRDNAFLQLERAIQYQDEAGILVHGMTGIGKTTLIKAFMHWLDNTNGLKEEVFYYSFHDIYNANYIISSISEKLFGLDSLTLPASEIFSDVVDKLRNNQHFLIWDNFESASGISGTEVTPQLSETDRRLLKEFLNALHGGKTKIFITSRSSEKWLSQSDCFRLPLSGLYGEELWQYSDMIIADFGLKLKRSDKSYQQLLDKLDGNPLAVKTVFSTLRKYKVSEILQALESENSGSDETNIEMFMIN